MKKIITTAFILLVAITVNAQRNVEKSVRVSNGQSIFVNFKFAHSITVKQWNKNTIEVKATVVIDNNKGNKDFSLKTSTSDGEVKIYSDFGGYLKRKRSWNNHNKMELNYVVYVPKNATLKVKSISGSLEIDQYTGNLTTDLISGDITIKNTLEK
ncbi:MAG: hypothetical protein JKZ00_05245 [Flavobacteriaceae bacterium]|nr:hypothetical protein [Flavobacteriaceae bacterium]